jgi:hypothetical protein
MPPAAPPLVAATALAALPATGSLALATPMGLPVLRQAVAIALQVDDPTVAGRQPEVVTKRPAFPGRSAVAVEKAARRPVGSTAPEVRAPAPVAIALRVAGCSGLAAPTEPGRVEVATGLVGQAQGEESPLPVGHSPAPVVAVPLLVVQRPLVLRPLVPRPLFLGPRG